MRGWIVLSSVGPFRGMGVGCVLALVALELRLREYGVFRTRRGIIRWGQWVTAFGARVLESEPKTVDSKQNARDQRLDFIQRPLPSDKTIPCL